MNKLSKSHMELLTLLQGIKPKGVAASDEIKTWWDMKALPLLKSQALSELHRWDCFEPRIIGFMKDGTMNIVDVSRAVGEFGSAPTKKAVAAVHRIAAVMPGTMASVFCCEAWSLRANNKGDIERQAEKYPNLGDHPDCIEIMVFSMLHYDDETNTMMQLMTHIEILKVLGQPRHDGMWAGTKLSSAHVTLDPLGNGPEKMEGQFVFNSREG